MFSPFRLASRLLNTRQSLHVVPRYWYWFRTGCVSVQVSQVLLINFLSYFGPDCIYFETAAKLKCRQVLGTSNRIVPSDRKPFESRDHCSIPSTPAKSTKNGKDIVIRDKIVMQCFLVACREYLTRDLHFLCTYSTKGSYVY